MKNPLQNLLVILALGLCALCAWQWYGQVQQRKEMTGLAQTNYDQSVAIQGYTNSINVMDKQMAQMDARITELKDTIRTNNVEMSSLREESAQLMTKVAQYSNTVEALNAQIKIANENIVRQNEALKNLVAERDQYVGRLNDMIKERNDVVVKYNELVKKFEEFQQSLQPKKKEKQ
jgi:chromosome segregation ATPase